MDFLFDFTYLKNGSPIVTLSALGLAFNKGAIDMLGAPDEVVVGYDEKRRAIGIRQATNEPPAIPRYKFADRAKNDWVRIGAKDFTKYLARISGIDFLSKAKQFVPLFDEDTRTLIVIVDEAHLK
ncbi:MAG: hypothetical protein IJK63_01135 [Oscillospiraceae bacterium]|nr:hypothetical protein [Oscillospiraceae bacterium]